MKKTTHKHKISVLKVLGISLVSIFIFPLVSFADFDWELYDSQSGQGFGECVSEITDPTNPSDSNYIECNENNLGQEVVATNGTLCSEPEPIGLRSENYYRCVWLGPVTLTTSISSGSGTITGSGISCPGDCSQSYTSGTWVTLIATESAGYTFGSWSGACAGQGSTCSIPMDADKSTSVSFNAQPLAPTVTLSASPTSVAYNTASTLTWSSIDATSCTASGGWSGAKALSGSQSTGLLTTNQSYTLTCTGPGGSASASAAVSVVAPVTYTLTTSISSGSGSGTITGSGISCPGDCNEPYTSGTWVSLIATESAGYTFGSWSGACAGQSSACSVLMNENKNTSANFSVIPPPFNYSLSNSGTSNVTKTSGNVFTQNSITKTLTAGVTQSVTLALSNVPAGTSYSISNGSCSPTCNSVITLTVTPSTVAGTYPITVTGSPLNKQTTFNLVVSGSSMSVSCSASPGTVLLGQNITWTATISGGTAPFTYSWSGTNIPTNPAPSTNPYTKSYSTIGQKSATVMVADSDSVQAVCPPATVQINFDPNFEEF